MNEKKCPFEAIMKYPTLEPLDNYRNLMINNIKNEDRSRWFLKNTENGDPNSTETLKYIENPKFNMPAMVLDPSVSVPKKFYPCKCNGFDATTGNCNKSWLEYGMCQQGFFEDAYNKVVKAINK